MAQDYRNGNLRPMEALFSVGSVGGMADGQLLERFLGNRDVGAEAAFAALVATHGPMVWDVCHAILRDSHLAEDAFQATFLILARRAASIRLRDAVGAWLFGVARRVAVRAKTTAAQRRLAELRGTNMQARPTLDPSRREQIEALHAEIDHLPEKYRAPVVLCHLEGRTHIEAARLLKCPVGTVSVRLSRARERLRARLTRRGVVVPAALAGGVLAASTSAWAMPVGLADCTTTFAMRVAAGKVMVAGMVPPSVARLAEGELKIMFLKKLSVVGAGVFAAGVATMGAGWLAASEREKPGGSQPAQVATAAGLAAGDDRADGERSVHNLKILALAMHNFASANDGRFPPAAIGPAGKPLLSWRVALLPFLDQQELYDRFHLDEPWDSPHNRALLKEMPPMFAQADQEGEAQGSTFYQALVGPGALFDGAEGTKFSSIMDRPGFTIAIVESAKPVAWTKPEDLPCDPEKPLPKLGGVFEGGFYVVFADGSALFLSDKVAPDVVRALITRSGGEEVSAEQLHR